MQFHFTGTIVRVVAAQTRFVRTLLAKTRRVSPVAPPGGNEDEQEQDETAVGVYVALRDTDVLGAADPRIVYTLVIEQMAGAEPWPLSQNLAQRQAKGTKQRPGLPSGRATVYAVVRVLHVAGGDTSSGPTIRMVADALPPQTRSLFVQRWPVSGQAGKEPVRGGVAGLVRMLTPLRLDAKQMSLCIDSLADCWMPLAYSAMTALSLARPSSLVRLSRQQLTALSRWLCRAETISWLRALGNDAGRLVTEALPCLSVLDTEEGHSSISACGGSLMPFSQTNAPTPFALALAGMRSSCSTVARLPDGDDDDAVVPPWAAVKMLGDNSAFTTKRYASLDDDVAAIVTREASRVIALVTPPGRGGPGAGPLYAERVPGLIRLLMSAIAAKCRVLFVAPTPGHAAAVTRAGLDVFSVQDVLADRVPAFWARDGQLACVCLLFAHGFGLRTFRDVWRRVAAAGKPLVLAMAGDRLSWGGEGSVHEGDGGAPFRDICAAIAANDALGVLEKIREAEGHWTDALYDWTEPRLPDAVAAAATAPTTTTPPMPYLVACASSWKRARAPKPSSPWWSVGTWGMVPSLGWLGPVSAATDDVRTGASFAMSDMPGKIHASARHVRVRIGADDGFDHSACCQTAAAGNVMSLAVHADYRNLDGGAPIRVVARCAPEPIADDLIVHMAGDDDNDDSGGRMAVQDVRAACSLARRSVTFITPDGTLLSVRDALQRQSGRARTNLVQIIAATAINRQASSPSPPPQTAAAAADAAVGSKPEAHNVVLVGAVNDTAMACSDVGETCVSADACRKHFVNWLRHGDVESPEPEPVWRSVSAPPALVRTTAVSLPRPFTLPDIAAADAMSKREVDTHVAARLNALCVIARGGGSDADIGYPPDDESLDRIARMIGGRRRNQHTRESVAVHVLCMAAKGDADTEAWLCAGERNLMIHRLTEANATDDALLSLVSAGDRDAVANSQDARKAIAGIHATRVKEYIAGLREPLPETNPALDEESDEFDFYRMLMTVQQQLHAAAARAQ